MSMEISTFAQVMFIIQNEKNDIYYNYRYHYD